MITFITVVHVLVCVILILMILLQAGKGNGLAGAAFTGSSEQSVFGTKTADVMTKTTAVSAVLFLITCISLSALTARKTRSLYSSFKNQAPITMSQVQKAVKEAAAKAKQSNTSSNSASDLSKSLTPPATQVQSASDSAKAIPMKPSAKVPE